MRRLGHSNGLLLGPAGAPPFVSADNPARQQQRYRNEQAAQYEQPIRREPASGEEGLGVVHDEGTENGTGEGAAAANSDPDNRLDRIAGGKLARIDDADLRHVERAGNAGHV